jgi:pilus assembly protein CpaE
MSPVPEKKAAGRKPAAAVSAKPFMAFVTDDVTRSQLERAAQETGFEGEVYVGGTEDALATLAEVVPARHLVLDLADRSDLVDAVNAFADVCRPDTRVLVLGAVNDVETYRVLMDMGVADYLVKPVAAGQLTEALIRLGAAEDAAVPADASQPAQRGTVSGVVSARGGAGASTVAVNLAWALSIEAPGKCALVDLDLRFGTTAMMLDLEPGRGFKEALDNPGRIDSLFMERAMVRAGDNLSLLAGEESIASEPVVAEGALDVLFDMLRGAFDHVVVDLPRWNLGDHLPRIDRLFLVTEPTLAGLRDALRLKDAAQELVGPEVPILIVLNKGGAAKKGELAEADAVKAGLPKPAYVLPEEPKFQPQAQAVGKPLVNVAPRAKASKIFLDMARDLAVDETQDRPSKSLFGLILGGRK